MTKIHFILKRIPAASAFWIRLYVSLEVEKLCTYNACAKAIFYSLFTELLQKIRYTMISKWWMFPFILYIFYLSMSIGQAQEDAKEICSYQKCLKKLKFKLNNVLAFICKYYLEILTKTKIFIFQKFTSPQLI